MSKDYSQILQAISSKLQESTVELIYRMAGELQPQAKAILDEALGNYPVGDRDPADAYLCLVNEVINVSFSTGFIAGATDIKEETKALIREWQKGMRAQGLPRGGLLEDITAKDLLAEIPGFNGGAKKAN